MGKGALTRMLTPDNDDLRVAIIGAGRMGADHAERLARRTRRAVVSAVVDVDHDRTSTVAAETQELQDAPVEALSSLEQVIEAGKADAVVLATPGFLHEEALLRLISAELPVLCEKPLTPGSQSAMRVLEAESTAVRRTIQVGFNRRFDDGYRQLKEVIDSGELGQLLMMHFQHRNPAAPEWFTEEMLINDSVVHEFDALRFFTGEEVASVQVRTGRQTSQGTMRDPQMVLLETTSGLLADVEIFMNSGLGYQVEVQGVFEGGVVSAGHSSGLQTTAAHQQSWPISDNFHDRFAESYDREIQEWVDAVRDGRAGGASVWDGYAVAACCEAGVASQQSGQIQSVSLIERPAFYA